MTDQLIVLERRGRRLHVTVGGELEYEFAPCPSTEGLRLASLYFGTVATAMAADDANIDVSAEETAQELVDVVFADQAEKIDADGLTSEESQGLLWSVFLWKVNGGGFMLADLATEDRPKAMERWQLEASLGMRVISKPGDAPVAPGDGNTLQNSSPQSKPKPTTPKAKTAR